MSVRDRNYWIEKSKEKVIWNEAQSNEAVKQIMFVFDETAFEVENRINALYQKYAEDNNLTLQEARKLISGKEYSVWRKSIEEYLAELSGDAVDSKVALELNTLAMKSRISREEKLLADIYRQMAELAEDYETNLTQLLGDITTSNYYKAHYNLQIGMKVGFEVGKISDTALKAILDYNWASKKFSKAVWDNVDAICANTQRAIMRGFTAGYSVQKMVKEIDDVMGKGRYVAERLVRTECKYFANQGELLAYKEDGIEKYVYMGGTEGGWVCDCAFYNNKIIHVDQAKAGVNFPPLHPNCKCAIRPYFENSILDNNKDCVPIDESMSFKDWKKEFVETPAKIKPKASLSEAEEYALNSYISSGAYRVNGILRSGGKLSKEDKEIIENLDKALDKMPDYRGTVYRSVSSFGIENVDAYIKSHKVGDDKIFPSYLSSSVETYDSSFPIQYVIKSKNGKDIRAYNQSEKEILFKRNTSFLITKIDGNTIYMEE